MSDKEKRETHNVALFDEPSSPANDFSSAEVVEEFKLTYEESPIVLITNKGEFSPRTAESYLQPEIDYSMEVDNLVLPIKFEDWDDEVVEEVEEEPIPVVAPVDIEEPVVSSAVVEEPVVAEVETPTKEVVEEIPEEKTEPSPVFVEGPEVEDSELPKEDIVEETQHIEVISTDQPVVKADSVFVVEPKPEVEEVEPVPEVVEPTPVEAEPVVVTPETTPVVEKEPEKPVVVPVQVEEKPKAVKKKKEKKKFVFKIRYAVLMILLATFIGVSYAGYSYISGNLEDVPELNVAHIYEYSKASEIYDIDGNFIAEFGANENVDWADIEEVPENLKNAFISIEDKRFYDHMGIDIKRLISAVYGQLTGTGHHGASTITQQLVKNTFLTQEVTYKRKIQEIYLSLKLERELSKDKILEAYMNTIFMGDSNYGIKVAAWDYFGKTLDQLTLRECAMLAGLAQSPNEYNPRLNQLKGDMGPTNYRTDTVLYTMHENEMISDEEYHKALNDKLVVNETTSKGELYAYPSYVEYAMENVAKKLLEKDEIEVNDESLEAKKKEIKNSGLKIVVALDTNIQDTLRYAVENFTGYPNAVDGSLVEASAVIMDHHTGRVVALAGGRHEQTEKEVLNRATDSAQPVGSSMKPLAVYAPALEEGSYPGTTVMDVPDSIEGYGADNGYPNGPTNNGPITMREGLEQSHNVSAARFLLEKVGINKSFNYLVSEGIDPKHLDHTPAGLALGAVSVTTMEMTAAYASLANDGIYIEPHAFTEVYDRNGELILDEDSCEKHRVFSESTAWLITDMMHTNMYQGLGLEANFRGMTIAGKTGTHENKAVTFGGYTPYYTSFLRISSDAYKSIYKASSYFQATRLWRMYMQPIHENLEDKQIQPKTAEELGIKKYLVCTNSGNLASDICYSTHWEYAAPNNAPTKYCTEHKTWYNEEDNLAGYMSWWDEFGVFHENGWWDEYGNFHLY